MNRGLGLTLFNTTENEAFLWRNDDFMVSDCPQGGKLCKRTSVSSQDPDRSVGSGIIVSKPRIWNNGYKPVLLKSSQPFELRGSGRIAISPTPILSNACTVTMFEMPVLSTYAHGGPQIDFGYWYPSTVLGDIFTLTDSCYPSIRTLLSSHPHQ